MRYEWPMGIWGCDVMVCGYVWHVGVTSWYIGCGIMAYGVYCHGIWGVLCP